MPDQPKPGGYIWRSEIQRAIQANRRARHDVARIAQMIGSNAELNKHLTRLILAIAEEQDALNKLKDIANGHKE
jgi:hypothetical protein